MGGGDYWVKGYRELVSRMRHITVPKNIPITTENAAEPYMDFVDGFLTWGDIREGEVPALAAVYSGYTIYFSSLVDRKTDVNSFFMRQARDMLWGSQPGWTREYILEEEFREHAKLLNMLCLYRLALKRFLIYGELMDEIRPLNEIPTIQGHWYSRRTKRFLTLDWPGVMGVVWKAPDDSLLALMANYSSEPQQFEYKLSLTKYAGVTDSTTPWTVFSVTPSGRTPLEHVTGDWIKREELLPPRGIRAIVIQPTNKTMPSERYPQKNR